MVGTLEKISDQFNKSCLAGEQDDQMDDDFRTSSLFFCTVHAEAHGLNVVPIKDALGKTVGLYKESHALVLGVADYSAGWPKLLSVIEETKQIEQALNWSGATSCKKRLC